MILKWTTKNDARGKRVKLKKHRYLIDAQDIGGALSKLLRIYARDKSNPNTVALQAVDAEAGVRVKIERMSEEQTKRARESRVRDLARQAAKTAKAVKGTAKKKTAARS